MMPGAAHRAIDHETLCQRAAVMRARCADGEKLFTASGHKNRFAKRVTQKHFSLAHFFGLIAFFKIRSLKFDGFFSHRISFCCIYESHRTDPATVWQLNEKKANPHGPEKYAQVPNNMRRIERSSVVHLIFQAIVLEELDRPQRP